jgi:hypothetical protein
VARAIWRAGRSPRGDRFDRFRLFGGEGTGIGGEKMPLRAVDMLGNAVVSVTGFFLSGGELGIRGSSEPCGAVSIPRQGKPPSPAIAALPWAGYGGLARRHR